MPVLFNKANKMLQDQNYVKFSNRWDIFLELELWSSLLSPAWLSKFAKLLLQVVTFVMSEYVFFKTKEKIVFLC